MNLHRHENAETKGQAWYLQPETTQNVHKAPVPAQETQPAPSTTPSLFEPSAAERILARAGALQEIHGQLLSQEQIEAIAAEIGIKPEFVHLAIKQEKNGILPQNKTASSATTSHTRAVLSRIGVITIAYGLFLTIVTAASWPLGVGNTGDLEQIRQQLLQCVVFYFPALLAIAFGILSRSRRLGAASGAELAVTVILAATIGNNIGGTGRWYRPEDVPFFAIMIGVGILLGAAGAQARRIVSRRQASNRSRQKIIELH